MKKACCKTLSGIPRDCSTNMGGIRRVWIACYDQVVANYDKESHIIDDFKCCNDVVVGEQAAIKDRVWKPYEFRKQSGSVSITPNPDDATGVLYYETVISLVFSKWETSKRLEMETLALMDLVVIVEDNNGKCWFFGYDYYVTLTGGSFETGTAFGDMNGYTIELTYVGKFSAIQVGKEAMDKVRSASELTPEVDPEE